MSAPIRVALVHMRHKGSGGTERHLNQTAQHLAEQGHAVTIVCRSHEQAPHPAVQFVRLHGVAPGAALRMWRFATDAAKHVRGAAYDVVYGLGRTWSQDIVRLGGGLVETQLEHARRSVHGVRERLALGTSLKWPLARVIERRMLAARPRPQVIVNAELVRRDLFERYPAWRERSGDVHVVHNAADCERFAPGRWRAEGAELRRSFGFGPDELVYLFLGTGYRRKGLSVLLRAFARYLERARELVPNQAPAARLAVVGYDSGRARYETLARELGVAQRVHFAGGRRDPQVCFAAADVYVLPTFYDPFAASTVEALASGLPVITTSNNGGSERVEEVRTGSIVPAGDAEALAQRLMFWSDRARIAQAAGLARAEALRFDEPAAMRAITELLQQVCAQRTRAPRA